MNLPDLRSGEAKGKFLKEKVKHSSPGAPFYRDKAYGALNTNKIQ
jgi:hypothetical protein